MEKDAAEAGFRSGRETDGARASSADARGGVRGVAIRARARTREGARHVQASLAALAQEHADHALVLGVILFSKERRATVGSAKDEAGGRRGHVRSRAGRVRYLSRTREMSGGERNGAAAEACGGHGMTHQSI